jgi:hypothetical protein
MVIKYQVFEKEKLLIQKFIGVFSIELYMRYAPTIMKNPAMRSINKVLNDFRDIDFSVVPLDFGQGLDKMTEIRKAIQEKEIKRDDVTVVFWVDKPIPTVIAQVFNVSFSNYDYCSTAKNILENFHITDPNFNLEDLVEDLENTF